MHLSSFKKKIFFVKTRLSEDGGLEKEFNLRYIKRTHPHPELLSQGTPQTPRHGKTRKKDARRLGTASMPPGSPLPPFSPLASLPSHNYYTPHTIKQSIVP